MKCFSKGKRMCVPTCRSGNCKSVALDPPLTQIIIRALKGLVKVTRVEHFKTFFLRAFGNSCKKLGIQNVRAIVHTWIANCREGYSYLFQCIQLLTFDIQIKKWLL